MRIELATMANTTVRRFSRLPTVTAAAILAAGIGFVGFAYATGTVDRVVGWYGFGAATLVAAWVLLVPGSKRRLAEHTATLNLAFAERGLRGVARIVDYAPVGSATRDKAPFKLTLEIRAPGWADTRTYWLSVHPVDIARLTTVSHLPCLVVPEEQPVVRLYVRRDIDAAELVGEGTLALPHPAGML
jgi:hypothetical protein